MIPATCVDHSGWGLEIQIRRECNQESCRGPSVGFPELMRVVFRLMSKELDKIRALVTPEAASLRGLSEAVRGDPSPKDHR